MSDEIDCCVFRRGIRTKILGFSGIEASDIAVEINVDAVLHGSSETPSEEPRVPRLAFCFCPWCGTPTRGNVRVGERLNTEWVPTILQLPDGTSYRCGCGSGLYVRHAPNTYLCCGCRKTVKVKHRTEGT